MRNDIDSERVTDPLDLATQREELARVAAMAARKPTGPAPTGFCLYCDEPVADGHRWCHAEHRDAWEREQR